MSTVWVQNFCQNLPSTQYSLSRRHQPFPKLTSIRTFGVPTAKPARWSTLCCTTYRRKDRALKRKKAGPQRVLSSILYVFAVSSSVFSAFTLNYSTRTTMTCITRQRLITMINVSLVVSKEQTPVMLLSAQLFPSIYINTLGNYMNKLITIHTASAPLATQPTNQPIWNKHPSTPRSPLPPFLPDIPIQNKHRLILSSIQIFKGGGFSPPLLSAIPRSYAPPRLNPTQRNPN